MTTLVTFLFSARSFSARWLDHRGLQFQIRKDPVNMSYYTTPIASPVRTSCIEILTLSSRRKSSNNFGLSKEIPSNHKARTVRPIVSVRSGHANKAGRARAARDINAVITARAPETKQINYIWDTVAKSSRSLKKACNE